MPAITLAHVRKTFGAQPAVDDLSLEIPEGTICGFIGPNGSGKTTTLRMIGRTGPHFLPERVAPGGRSDDALLVELSDRVRDGDLFAFVVVPAAVLDGNDRALTYYREQTSYTTLSSWLNATVNAAVQSRRLAAAGVDPDVVTALTRRTPLETFELVERDSMAAVFMSFVPLLTPFAMPLRLAAAPGPPLWQPVLAVLLLVVVTAGIVWIAGRIFRIGLLMQGKAPNLPELVRWVRR